jgi:opacity protein-like surface antigen
MRTCLALLVCLLVPTGPAAAQSRLPPPNPRPAPDFFFSAPKGSATVRGSWLFARASSDWYDFVTGELTVEPADFNAAGLGIDVGVAVTPRLEVQFGLDYSGSQVRSEYRNFVDNNRLPITQQTRLREANLSGNLKVALTDRGRDVSRFAWVPRTIVPYAGAGAGAIWFNVSQVGDFVDFVDLAVFSDVFESNGWTPSAQVFAGADVRVFRRLYLTVDGRYLWAAGDLGREWIDFDPIDLAGFRLSAGFNVVF